MTFTETAMGAALTALAGALVGGLSYIFNLGARVTKLEASTAARHEENLRTLNQLQESVDRIEEYLIGRRR